MIISFLSQYINKMVLIRITWQKQFHIFRMSLALFNQPRVLASRPAGLTSFTRQTLTDTDFCLRDQSSPRLRPGRLAEAKPAIPLKREAICFST